jgi:hypothetical protein
MWMKRRKKSDRKPRSSELPLPAIADLGPPAAAASLLSARALDSDHVGASAMQ